MASKTIIVDLGSENFNYTDGSIDSKSNLNQQFEDTVVFDDNYQDINNPEVVYFPFYTEEFVPNQSFFLNNMRKYFAKYDWDLIQEEEKKKIFVDAVAAEFDVIAGKVGSLVDLIDLDNAPVEALPYLGYLIGYQVLDFSISGFNTKELLKGIIDIYRIKGTNISFDIFFTALGYDVSVKELWWEDVTREEAKNEYYLKLKSWEELNQNTKNKIKKRIFNLNELDYYSNPDDFYKTNKSNFVKIKMRKRENDKGGFSQDEFLLSLKYLRFLTPAHVNILSLNLIFEFDEIYNLIYRDGRFATIEILPLPNEDNVLTPIPNPNYNPSDPWSKEFIYDPLNLSASSLLISEDMIIYPSVISQSPAFLNRYIFDDTEDPMYKDLGFIIDPNLPWDYANVEENLNGNNLVHYPLNSEIGIQTFPNRYLYYGDGWSNKDYYIKNYFPNLNGKTFEDFIDYKTDDIPIVLNSLPFGFDQFIAYKVRYFTGDCSYAPSGVVCDLPQSIWNPTIHPIQIYVDRMKMIEDLPISNLDAFLSGQDESDYIGYDTGEKYLSFDEIYPFNNAGYEVPLRINQNLFQGNVIDKDLTTPPATPLNGDRYLLVNEGDTGTDWENKKNVIAEYDGSNWNFEYLYIEGSVFVEDEYKYYTYQGINNWTSNFNDLINNGVNFQFDGLSFEFDNSGNVSIGNYLYTDSGSFVPNPPINSSGSIYGNPYSGIQHPEDTDAPVSNQALGMLDVYRNINDGTRLIAVDNFLVWYKRIVEQEEIFIINDINANNYIVDNNHITVSGDDYGVEDFIFYQSPELIEITDDSPISIGFSFADDFLEPYVNRDLYHPDHNFFQSNIPNTEVNRMAYYHDTLEIFSYVWEVLSGGIRRMTMESFEDLIIMTDMTWLEILSNENISFSDTTIINGEEFNITNISPNFEESIIKLYDYNNENNDEDNNSKSRDLGSIIHGNTNNHFDDVLIVDNSLEDLTPPSGIEPYYDVVAKYYDYDIATGGVKQKESSFFMSKLKDSNGDEKEWFPIFAPTFTHYDLLQTIPSVSVKLFWEDLPFEDATNQDKYTIYYNTTNSVLGASHTPSFSKNDNSSFYQIDNLINGYTYYFWIKAKRVFDGFEDETNFSEVIVVETQ